jgi:hypothetical protein
VAEEVQGEKALDRPYEEVESVAVEEVHGDPR